MDYAWTVCLPLLAVGIVIAAHLILLRWYPGQHWSLILGASGIMGFVLFFASFRSLGPEFVFWDCLGVVMLNMIIFAGGCYGYFTVINLNITSLRIRVLKMLYASPEPSLAYEQLRVEYHPELILGMRLDRMAKISQISYINVDGEPHYQLKRQDLWQLRRLILALRRFLNVRPWA